MSIICDTGPIIHLDELRCLDLLGDFGEVLVPDTVWREVDRIRASALRRRAVKLEHRLELPAASPELSQLSAAFSLASGEVGALRLMQDISDAILLTDDSAARLVAERLEYEVHGTLGVIVRAIRRRQRTKRQVLNLLRSIPYRSTLFVERRLLESIIAGVQDA
jgi:predicted nucleic acid-binding protein